MSHDPPREVDALLLPGLWPLIPSSRPNSQAYTMVKPTGGHSEHEENLYDQVLGGQAAGRMCVEVLRRRRAGKRRMREAIDTSKQILVRYRLSTRAEICDVVGRARPSGLSGKNEPQKCP